MEFVMGVLTGYVLTWPAIIVLVLLGVFCEHVDSPAWAVFFGLGALVVSYFVFDVSAAVLGIASGAYLLGGLIWSFWRYKRFVDANVKEIMARSLSPVEKQSRISTLQAKNHIGTLTYWFVIWPISLIENLTGDIITVIQDYIIKSFHAVYEKIWDSSTKDAYSTIAQQIKADKDRKNMEAIKAASSTETAAIIVQGKNVKK